MQYDYVRVSLHGHFDNKLSLRYSFNSSSDPASGWEASLPDPEAIVRSFMSVRDCYVLWANHFGRYFSLITNNPLDPRAVRVMITVQLDNGDALTGRQIFSALNQLKKAFLEDDNISDDGVEKALKAAMLPEKPLQLPTWAAEDPADDAKPMCYRTYLSTRELEGIFSFPMQAEYEGYRYDIVINATSSLRPGVAIDRVTTPVKRLYAVIVPEGVTASATEITEGERLTLTFSKDDFNPRTETITIGTPSPYIRYDGSAIIVKAPADSGMGFVRRVRLNVSSAKGGVVNGYTVSVNDRPVNTMDSFVELTESDLRPDRKIIVQAASNNFHPLKVELNPSEINSDTVIDLKLVPIEQGIVLRLDFGEGRIVEQEISLEKNTPEYSQLRSGNFHGFRAHRLPTEGGGEVYNVDVRAAGKPVAPTFEKATTHTPRPQIVKPVITRATDTTPQPEEPVAEEPVVEKPDAVEENPAEESGDVPEYGGMLPDTPRRSRLGLWVSIAAVVVLLVAAVCFLPGALTSDEGNEPQAGAEVVTVKDAENPTPAPAAAAPAAPTEAAPAAFTADEQADIAYLNTNGVWRVDDMKSDIGRGIFSALAAGDIKALAESPYFARKGVAENANAVKAIDLLWAASGSDTERGNQLKMEAAGKKGEVNVLDFYEAIARLKPKTPNETPRPVK